MKGINGKLRKMKGKKVKVVGYGIGEKGGLIPGKTKVFCCCGKGVFCCNPRNVRFPRFGKGIKGILLMARVHCINRHVSLQSLRFYFKV
jgi:hypothetical protein